jgi:hypothetical protein
MVLAGGIVTVLLMLPLPLALKPEHRHFEWRYK